MESFTQPRNPIRILDEKTINQIAAGEVIENPASVVKELVENALDSGASEILVETKGGGRGLVKVADDGCGMSRDDLLLSIERHATSKLSEVEGLDHLDTLGFRGEALPSIASVSKMTLHSASASGIGSFLEIEGGKIGRVSPQPRQRGTTIEVRSLFFNVPVRRKFQKSVGWDTGEIHKILIKFALSYPGVGFTWVSDEKQQFTCPREQDKLQRIALLLGEEFVHSSLPMEQFHESLRLEGRISLPSHHRPTRTGQYLFINQRMVVSPWVGQKVLEAYGTRLSSHRYPFFVLYLTLPPSWIDVNVHPQKREVRLREEEKLTQFIHTSVDRALNVTTSSSVDFFPAAREIPEIFLSFPKEETAVSISYERQPEPFLHVSEPQEKYEIYQNPPLRVVGKVKNYLFVEDPLGIRLVDGTRALERIIFEELQGKKQEQSIQALVFPIQMHVAGTERILLERHLESLNEIGISIRHFGGETFIVDAIPSLLEPHEIQDLIYAYLEEGAIPKKMGKCIKRTIASIEVGSDLVKRLFQCRDPDRTPNGKPIHSLLDQKTLEKYLL